MSSPNGDRPPLQDIAEVLYDQKMIRQKVRRLANAISRDYMPALQADPRWALVVVSVLRGAVFFVADLTRALRIPAHIDFMAITPYGETGRVRILKDLDEDITDRDVLVVEDIIDTGLTLGYLLSQLRLRKPRSLTVATLIDRVGVRLVTDLPIKYSGFAVGNQYLVGYGLDFKERFRNLPYIGVLRDEVVAEAGERPRFAHPSEAEFARLLDFYRIHWEYEPKTFVLREDEAGNVRVGFSPDFYLPDYNLYVELTTKKSHLMSRKLRQVDSLRQQYPGIQIELLDRADFEILAKKLQGRERG